MGKERLEKVKKAYITTDEVLNSPAGHQYGIDEKRAIKDFIFAINYLEQQNKRYRELLEKVDYLLEKAGKTDEDIYGLVRHVRTLIYLEGEEIE